MAKTKEDTTIDYSYLTELQAGEDESQAISAPAEFSKLWFGHPNHVEVDGVVAEKTKFSAEGFPEQNLEEFYFIPLHLNANRRLMYAEKYSGGECPPDCQSNDGVQPLEPIVIGPELHVMFNKPVTITSCHSCPLHGFGAEFKCRTRPLLIGFAWFPEQVERPLIPVRKDIPPTSIKAFNQMVRDITSPIRIGDKDPFRVPYWSRVLKVKFGGLAGNYKTPTWGFEVLNPNEKHDVPTFIPPEFVSDIKAFIPAARLFARADVVPTTHQIGSGQQAAGQLESGKVQTDPNPEASVVAAEAESDY